LLSIVECLKSSLEQLLSNENRVSSNLLSDNEIEKRRKINKFKKILNVKKLREYKRLLTLILRESLNQLYNTKLRSRQ